MNTQPDPEGESVNASPEEVTSAMFAHMIIQQTNLALMLLGKTPHPETGKTMQDIEGARMFIDQMEMLEVKTRGNLTKDEEKMLKQSLTALRMAFVETIDHPAGPAQSAPSTLAGEPAKSAGSAKPSAKPGQPDTPPAEEETRKKFSKKY